METDRQVQEAKEAKGKMAKKGKKQGGRNLPPANGAGCEITALYADENGEIFDAPGMGAVGRSGSQLRPLTPEDLIPLPESADLMFLPDRQAREREPMACFVTLPLPLVWPCLFPCLPIGSRT